MELTRFSLLTVPVACAALALAACGDGNSSTDSRDPQADFREASLRYAECMRRNGVDMPDPSPDEGGLMLREPGSNGDNATFERAQAACRKHLENVEPPEISDEEEREFREAALRFARCMREHGIDMADPTFGEGGQVQMRVQGEGDPEENPAFKQAEKECGELGPPNEEGS